MRLKVDKTYGGNYRVYKHSFLFGWEAYDGLTFNSYQDAVAHAARIKELDK